MMERASINDHEYQTDTATNHNTYFMKIVNLIKLTKIHPNLQKKLFHSSQKMRKPMTI